MASHDVLGDIYQKMIELIQGMRIVDGYYYDWDLCNSDTLANRTPPYANVTFNEEVRDDFDEIEEDSLETTHFNAYTVEFELIITPAFIEPGINANYRAQPVITKTIADIRRLLNKNICLDTGDVVYQNYVRSYKQGEKVHNRADVPETIVCVSRCRYTQAKEFD